LSSFSSRCKTGIRPIETNWDHNDVRDVDYVTGACMIVRREALADVGLMDEGYELYFEDQDWCYRMWRHGWRVAYVPQAQMIHHHQRASARRLSSRSTRVHVRSMIRYFRKHHLPTPLGLRVQESLLGTESGCSPWFDGYHKDTKAPKKRN